MSELKTLTLAALRQKARARPKGYVQAVLKRATSIDVRAGLYTLTPEAFDELRAQYAQLQAERKPTTRAEQDALLNSRLDVCRGCEYLKTGKVKEGGVAYSISCGQVKCCGLCVLEDRCPLGKW